MASMQISVSGMTCGSCEASVKSILERLPGVTSARADHVSGVVDLDVTARPPDDVLRDAIEDGGFTFEGAASA